MAEYKGKYFEETAQPKEKVQPECDIRVWDESCRRSEYTSDSDKYLCAACGKIPAINREVHHEHFPHLVGDEDEMS